jgi:hypothetical protein
MLIPGETDLLQLLNLIAGEILSDPKDRTFLPVDLILTILPK